MARLSEEQLILIADDALNAVGGRQRMWRHVKTGERYVIRRVGLRESDHEPLVMYGKVGNPLTWCRPVTEFLDGRFRRAF